MKQENKWWLHHEGGDIAGKPLNKSKPTMLAAHEGIDHGRATNFFSTAHQMAVRHEGANIAGKLTLRAASPAVLANKGARYCG